MVFVLGAATIGIIAQSSVIDAGMILGEGRGITCQGRGLSTGQMGHVTHAVDIATEAAICAESTTQGCWGEGLASQEIVGRTWWGY